MAKKAKFGEVIKDVGMMGLQATGAGQLAGMVTGKSLDDLLNYQYKTKAGKTFDKGSDKVAGFLGATAPLAGAVGAGAVGLPPSLGAAATSMGQNVVNSELDKRGIGTPKPPKPEASTTPTPDYMKDTNLASAIPSYTPYKKGGPAEGHVINVEKDELEVNPKTGEIVSDYKDKPKHPKGKDVINQKGNVVAQEGNVIIPAKYREDYIKGSKEERMEIIHEVMENFMENEMGGEMEDGGEEVEKAEKGTVVPSIEGAIKSRGLTPKTGLGYNFAGTNYTQAPASLSSASGSSASSSAAAPASTLGSALGGSAYSSPDGTTGLDANQTALMYGLSGASQMPFYAKNKKEAQAALDKLSKTPLPNYSITPEMLQARQRAGQDYSMLQAMAKSGYTPQEQAAIQQRVAQGQRTAMLNAQNAGTSQAALNTAFNQQNINAILDIGARDAALRRQNIAAAQQAGRYLDQTGADISAQRNRALSTDIQRRALQEQTLGAALSQAKVGHENAQSQVWGSAGLALSNYLAG